MIWCDLWPWSLYFVLVIVQNFTVLGCMYHCQLWLKSWKKWKLLEILWNFPNLVTFSGSPSIPVSKVTLSSLLERLVILFISSGSHQQTCFPLFLWKDYLAPFVFVYFVAYGTPGCLEGKLPQNCRSLYITSYLGQYISLGLTKNNSFHFFF